eukprot:124068_1
MIQQKDDLVPLIVNDELYIFGGREFDTDAVSSVEVCDLYDESSSLNTQTPTDLNWEYLSNIIMPQPLHLPAFASTTNDVLYILAGRTIQCQSIEPIKRELMLPICTAMQFDN